MTLRAVVYSDDSAFRRYVIDSVGTATHPAVSDVVFDEVASYRALIALVDAGGVDLMILDAEATAAGSMDIARRLKDEFDCCPPILLVVAQAADAWLALWSKADATVGPRRDPVAMAGAVTGLMARGLSVPGR